MQVICLLQFGYSERLQMHYQEAATMAHQSQLEIARYPAEGAAARRRALDETIRELKSRISGSTPPGVLRELRNLEEQKKELSRVIGVGKEGGHRDRVPKLVISLL